MGNSEKEKALVKEQESKKVWKSCNINFETVCSQTCCREKGFSPLYLSILYIFQACRERGRRAAFDLFYCPRAIKVDRQWMNSLNERMGMNGIQRTRRFRCRYDSIKAWTTRARQIAGQFRFYANALFLKIKPLFLCGCFSFIRVL